MNNNNALRPSTFDTYIGQPQLLNRLRILVDAAKSRGEALPHQLLTGPPGLGKTTLAMIIAAEMGATCHVAMGPGIEKPQDLFGLLSRLRPLDVLFIDEIHRLSPVIGECLYPALEDGHMTVMFDTGASSRAITIPLPPFTLIGATTQPGLLEAPLRERFGPALCLDFYSNADLSTILTANAVKLGLEFEPAAIALLASRSRGTPRVGNHLLKFGRDVAQVRGDGVLSVSVAQAALKLQGIDSAGLNQSDRDYLRVLTEQYKGGPAGAQAIAATLSVTAETVAAVTEPFLLVSALIARTPRGRCITDKGRNHLASLAA